MIRDAIDALPPWVVLAAVLAAAATIVLLAGAAVTEVLDEVMGGEGDGRVDDRIVECVEQRRSPALTAFFGPVTRLADGWFAALVVAATATVLFARRRRALAVAVVVSSVGAAAITSAVKELVGRNRPDVLAQLVEASGAAFPSGHSSQAVACYGALALVVVVTSSRRARRTIAPLLALTLAILVGASRVYLGVHWPSDVLSGWIVGAAWLTAVSAVTWALYRVDRPRGWWGRPPP